MPEPTNLKSPNSAAINWSNIRAVVLLAVIALVGASFFLLLPSHVGGPSVFESPNPSVGYFKPAVLSVRDLPANTIIQSADVKLGRVYYTGGYLSYPTVEPVDTIAYCVRKRIKVAVYKDQILSFCDFGNAGRLNHRVVLSTKNIARGDEFTRSNITVGWLETFSPEYDFLYTELPQVLGRYSKCEFQPGDVLFGDILMPKYYSPADKKVQSSPLKAK